MNRKNALTWFSELLHRFFSGTATREEKDVIQSWHPEETEKRFTVHPEQVEGGCRRVREHVFSTLDIKEPEINYRPEKKQRAVLFQKKYIAAAACIAILIGTGLYFYVRDDRTENRGASAGWVAKTVYYETNSGEMTEVRLSDGSVIHLNKDSRLYIVEGEFNKQKREVWLEKGEAFFEVVKNPDVPFIVHSPQLHTTVKGTSFNVKAYKELNESSVSVKNGKVEVSDGKKILGVLTTNKQIDYHLKTKQFVVRTTDWQNATSWMEQRIVLDNVDVQELALRLKQNYGVTLSGYENTLRDLKLNAIFKKEATIENVMDNISALYNFDYQIHEKEVIITK